jgi:hypothetical protein
MPPTHAEGKRLQALGLQSDSLVTAGGRIIRIRRHIQKLIWIRRSA